MDNPVTYDPKGPRVRRASLEDLAELLKYANESVEAKRLEALRPDSSKTLRLFTLTDVCDLLDIHPPVYYEFVKNRPEFEGRKVNNQRLFTLEEIHAMQVARGIAPRQRLKIDRALTISVGNFKGGVAKTFTATHLAQYLTLRGYRTLLIDLDPQGSLSTMLGHPSGSVNDWSTVLPYYYGRDHIESEAKRLEDPDFTFPKSLRESIQPTYWHGLDIIAANLNLYSGEFVLGIRREREPGFMFHRPLHEAIETIRGDYDIIMVDNAPSLSLSTAGAIFAADALMIPLQAEFLDFESARAFLKLATEILGAIKSSYNDNKAFELFRILVTRFKPSQREIANDILSIFGPYCVPEPVIDTAAVSKAGEHWKTLYEVTPREAGRGVLKRAMECLKDVNSVLEHDIEEVFRARQALQPESRAAKAIPAPVESAA